MGGWRWIPTRLSVRCVLLHLEEKTHCSVAAKAAPRAGRFWLRFLTRKNSTGSIRRLISATCSSVSCQVAPKTINSTSCWPGTGRRPARRLTEPLHECAPPPLRAPADDRGGHAARQALSVAG